VLDTGAPLITLTLKRNGSYPQSGQAEDVSSYQGTVLAPADLAAAVGPAHTAANASPPVPTPKIASPAKTVATPATVKAKAKPAATAAKKVTWPQSRPAAFAVPGARKEPLDEMPLATRALQLRSWLEAHPTKSSANVSHWLYQNAWIVAGAKLGWWRGADALTTLIAVDRRAQQLWGIGSKSAQQAQGALTEVQSKTQ
jgi:hypothetical protein